MKIVPYISVKNAKKAIEVYQQLFDAKLVDHMPFDKEIGSQMGFPEDFDYENSTMHAVLNINWAEVYISDSMDSKPPGPVEIVLDFDCARAWSNMSTSTEWDFPVLLPIVMILISWTPIIRSHPRIPTLYK